MGLNDFTFYDLINRNATCFPNNQAWFEVDTGRTLTFAAFKENVEHLACGLQEIGLDKGDRIGVLGKNSLEYFLLYGAAAALGLIVVPINWRLSAGEVVFNLNDCQPRNLFVDHEYQSLITEAQAQLRSVKSCHNLKDGLGEFEDWQALMQNNGQFEPIEVLSADGFVIIHTAAVAGRPRGALVESCQCAVRQHAHEQLFPPPGNRCPPQPFTAVSRGRTLYGHQQLSCRRLEYKHEQIRCGYSSGPHRDQKGLPVIRFSADSGFHFECCPGKQSRPSLLEIGYRHWHTGRHRALPKAVRRHLLLHVRPNRNLLSRNHGTLLRPNPALPVKQSPWPISSW